MVAFLCLPIPLKFCPNLYCLRPPNISANSPIQLILEVTFVQRFHVVAMGRRKWRNGLGDRHDIPESIVGTNPSETMQKSSGGCENENRRSCPR